MIVCVLGTVSCSFGQSPIVLRDLTLIRGATVVEFDNAIISLSNGQKLGWDEILQAEVAPERQTEFNRLIKEIGLPRMRLKTRIKNGDWIGAGEIAEPMFESNSSGADPDLSIDDEYLISLATMRVRLGRGQRARAIWPFIQSSMLQSEINETTSRLVGEDRLTAPIVRRFLSDEILPVWLGQPELTQIADRLTKLLESQPDPRPGIMVYLASMQIELGRGKAAEQTMQQLASVNDPQIVAWTIVLKSRIKLREEDLIGAQAILESGADDMVGTARIAALYYRGFCVDLDAAEDASETVDIDRAKAMLALLRIPALYGDAYPDLAAAALFRCAELAKLRHRDVDEQKLRDELLKRFPRTYHGALESNNRSGD